MHYFIVIVKTFISEMTHSLLNVISDTAVIS